MRFYAITQKEKVALGVPKTDIKGIKSLAYFNDLVGFEDEVGMIHSIAHSVDQFGIKKGTVGHDTEVPPNIEVKQAISFFPLSSPVHLIFRY